MGGITHRARGGVVAFVSSNTGTKSIFAPVAAFSFSAAQFDECRNFLAARTANTECVPVVDEAQLVMNADGRLAESGYRYNSLGFSALATSLAHGLNPLFNELSGENKRVVAAGVAECDVATAVSIYNMVLRVRFEALRERNLLVNHREQTIDGFLGLDHRLLDNSAFLDIICNELQDKQPAAQFSRAEIIGRELRLYFIDPTSRRNDIYTNPRHTFAAGWYFSNREDTGLAVRASTCLYTKFGVAVTPAGSNARVKHTGADLAGRTQLLVSRTVEKKIDMDLVARQVAAMSRVSLNLSDDKATLDAATNALMLHLSRFKVARDDARSVIKNASMVGADLEPRVALEAYTKEALRARTVYDLFCSILRYAKNQYHVQRDVLQAAAMQLLLPDSKKQKRK
jgi:hypothetical protein